MLNTICQVPEVLQSKWAPGIRWGRGGGWAPICLFPDFLGCGFCLPNKGVPGSSLTKKQSLFMLEWTVETHSLFFPVPAIPCNLALFFPSSVQQRRNELSQGCPRRLAQMHFSTKFAIYKQNQGSGEWGLLCFTFSVCCGCSATLIQDSHPVLSTVQGGYTPWILLGSEYLGGLVTDWVFYVFELWCWRRLLRVPWSASRSNQSILKLEINPEYSL